MKKKVYFIFFIFYSINLLIGQSRYLKFIEKGKYAKAERKINKALIKEPKDVGHNFTMAMLLINRKYKGFNTSKSYEYLIISENLYSNIVDEKVIKNLNKIPIDKVVFLNYTDTICKYALDDAITLNKLEVYEKYLEFYKKTPLNYKNILIQNRNILAFKIAATANTVESFQYFITRYPDASQIIEAISKRNERAFEKVKSLNTLEAYQNFINLYPNASQITEAMSKRNERAFDKAKSLNTLEAYQNFINLYPNAIQNVEAISKRNERAFDKVKSLNTLEAYQNFINLYPNASQITEAISKRNERAFDLAKTADNINDYKKFISNYQKAKEVKEAWTRIHELAFMIAEKENTAKAYKKFMDEYPKCKQYDAAFKLFEEKQFFEKTTIGDWGSYKSFIENYPTHPWINIASDSIYSISKVTENLDALKYCVNNFSGDQRNKALILFHDIYTNDGEKSTLDLFYEKYDDDILESIKTTDYEIAEQGNQLQLHLPYNLANYSEYDNYIRLAAPREKAFVALQRMVSKDINQKNWQVAINKVINYTSYFGDKNKKIVDLINILKAKSDNSIKTIAFPSQINTKEGGEYTPVITADERYIYFCGRNRKDNIGGEDVYGANFKSRSPAKVVSELSSANSNDAPVSISTDGTSMMLFKDGKLYSSEKTNYGWNNAIELSNEINSSIWQADANISSDGNALIFSTIRKGNYDYNINIQPGTYHGEGNFASDIYVSLKNNNDEWQTPVNIGPTINTIYCDRSPFLHPDMKTLYFSSSGHGGLGDLDVYKSTRLNDSCWNCWSEPINMGKEINSFGSDWGYRISTNGEKAYFSKSSTENNEDIYWLNLPPHLRPDFVATVSGKLLDKNNKPVAAEIIWEDLQTGKSIGQSKSDPNDGSFFIVLPLGKIYGYYVDKDEYFPLSNNLDLTKEKKAKDVEENIDLVTFKEMIEKGIAVPVNNLFFYVSAHELLPASLPELKRIAKIIKLKKIKVEISGHSDNTGTEDYNQKLSELRANAVKLFLIKEGCNSDMLSTIGYGSSKPIDLTDTEEGRSRNRRFELKFIK